MRFSLSLIQPELDKFNPAQKELEAHELRTEITRISLIFVKLLVYEESERKSMCIYVYERKRNRVS